MSLASLIVALWFAESGGKLHPPPGRDGEVGPLQIRACVVADLQRWGYAYTLADRDDLEKSKQMCRIYLTRYGTRRRLGHAPTFQDYARIWNGGPDGFREPETLPYWRKVQRQLEKR